MNKLNLINEQINNIFACNDVLPDGPGEEAFWNAVLEVQRVNVTASEELRVLSDTWEQLRANAETSGNGADHA